MTLVVEPLKGSQPHNPLEPSVRRLLPALADADRTRLLKDLRSGAVTFSVVALEIREKGVSAGVIAGLERKRDNNTPDGLRAPGGLRSRLSKAVRELREAGDEATDKQREKPGKIRQQIADAPKQREAAAAQLALANERNAERTAAFRRWLANSGLSSYWRQPDHMDLLVAALNPEVTYVHFMVVPGDTVGTLLVETD